MAAEELQIDDGIFRSTLDEMELTPREETKYTVLRIQDGLNDIVRLAGKYDPTKSLSTQKELQDNMKKSMTDLNRRIKENPRLLIGADREFTKFFLSRHYGEEAYERLAPQIYGQLNRTIGEIARDDKEHYDPVVANIDRQEADMNRDPQYQELEQRPGETDEQYEERSRIERRLMELEEQRRAHLYGQQRELTWESHYRRLQNDPDEYRYNDMTAFNEESLQRSRDMRGSGMAPILTSHYNIAKYGQLY